MKKEVAHKLGEAISQCAANFSRPDRQHNHTNETFTAHEVVFISANCALVTFMKNTGKLSLAFFYYMRNFQDGVWKYFMISYDHIPVMEKVAEAMLKVEAHNFPLNFGD